jgi:hypothetical protein
MKNLGQYSAGWGGDRLIRMWRSWTVGCHGCASRADRNPRRNLVVRPTRLAQPWHPTVKSLSLQNGFAATIPWGVARWGDQSASGRGPWDVTAAGSHDPTKVWPVVAGRPGCLAGLCSPTLLQRLGASGNTATAVPRIRSTGAATARGRALERSRSKRLVADGKAPSP